MGAEEPACGSVTAVSRNARVRDTRRGDVGTARTASDPISKTVCVDWDAGGLSVVWIGRLAVVV